MDNLNLKNRCFENKLYVQNNKQLYSKPIKNNNKLKTYHDDSIYDNNTFYDNNTVYDNNTFDSIEYYDNKKYTLPDNWLEKLDKKTGRYYYICLTTKHTQWLHPSIPIGTIMKNGLPYGWESKIDSVTKRKYYINHVGRFTTWNPPVKQRKYKGSEYIW
jgi:hypothetical protein